MRTRPRLHVLIAPSSLAESDDPGCLAELESAFDLTREAAPVNDEAAVSERLRVVEAARQQVTREWVERTT